MRVARHLFTSVAIALLFAVACGPKNAPSAPAARRRQRARRGARCARTGPHRRHAAAAAARTNAGPADCGAGTPRRQPPLPPPQARPQPARRPAPRWPRWTRGRHAAPAARAAARSDAGAAGADRLGARSRHPIRAWASRPACGTRVRPPGTSSSSRRRRPTRSRSASTHSDLAFTGKYVVQGNYNGFDIFDMSNPAKPVRVTTYTLPGVAERRLGLQEPAVHVVGSHRQPRRLRLRRRARPGQQGSRPRRPHLRHHGHHRRRSS